MRLLETPKLHGLSRVVLFGNNIYIYIYIYISVYCNWPEKNHQEQVLQIKGDICGLRNEWSRKDFNQL